MVIARTNEGIQQAIETAFRLLEISIEPDLPIIIKPNLCTIKGPETGTTTDPRVVEAVINYMKMRYRSKVFYIVESDATALNADMAFQLLGYNMVAKHTGANIVNLSKISYRQLRFQDNLNLTKIRIPQIFQKPHFLISIAKMKTSDMCHLTATLKNMYGCNPEPYKAKYHKMLHENIVDFAQAFRPHLSIVDAITAMEGTGPIGGVPLVLNTLIFGTNSLAVDHLVAKIMGINPDKVKYLNLARKKGLGTTKYEVKGASLNEIKRKFKGRPLIVKFYSRIEPLIKVMR